MTPAPPGASRTRRTWTRAGKVRNLLKFLVWLATEREGDPEIHAVQFWPGAPRAGGRRRDDAPQTKPSRKKTPGRKTAKRKNKTQHERELSRLRSQQYRARVRQQKDTP